MKSRRKHEHYSVKNIKNALVSYLKRLEGEAYVEALSDRNLPHAHFVWPVVIGVVGRLDLAIVLLHLPATDGCMWQLKQHWAISLLYHQYFPLGKK